MPQLWCRSQLWPRYDPWSGNSMCYGQLNKEKFLSSPHLCGSCEHKPCWFSKPEVLAACFSDAGLKSCGARCGAQMPGFPGRGCLFWALCWLGVIVLGVRFVARFYLSFSSPFWWGFFFFLVLVMRKRCSASLNFFQKKVLHRLKKKCASCRFDMSMAEGDT